MTYRPDGSIKGKFDTADYITVTTATANIGTHTGTVSDMQTMEDGNELIINEINTTDYIDTDFDFENVAEIYGIVTRTYYDGNHYTTINMYDWVATADHLLIREDQATDYNIRTIMIPNDIQSNYIGTGGNDGKVRITILHELGAGGNTAHDFHVDYIAILGKST